MSDQNINESDAIIVNSDCATDYIETVACSGERIVADNSFSHSCHRASRAFCEKVRMVAEPDSDEIKLYPDLDAISSDPCDSVTCALSSDVLTENNIIYLINNNIVRNYIEKADLLEDNE